MATASLMPFLRLPCISAAMEEEEEDSVAI